MSSQTGFLCFKWNFLVLFGDLSRNLYKSHDAFEAKNQEKNLPIKPVPAYPS